MSFHDVRFPTVIAVEPMGGPAFSTDIATTASGAERRNARWSQALGKWNVGTGLRSRADLALLTAFFRARLGRAFAFRFKDWSDFQMPRQVIGTTNGSLASYPIYRRYSSGGIHQDRPITLPVAGSVRCWQNGVERTLGAGGTQFQVNLLTGLVTLGSTLAATNAQAVEVECEFDVPARFDTDALGISLRTFESGQWADIPILEVRP